ncbi:MAG: TadA family conjugal transfer-associated ATPase [Ornithinimicrobium sp.]
MSATDVTITHQIGRGRLPTAGRVSAISAAQHTRLGSVGAAQMHEQLSSDVLGLGPLHGLLADPDVTDILVNGPGEVWIDRGSGVQQCDVRFTDEASLRALAVRLASLTGQRLDDASPFVDGLLPEGIRLHALLPPLVTGGAHISLRIPRRTPPSLSTLRRWGMFAQEGQAILVALVQARVAFVIGGGTGSGKTTLLAALLAMSSPQERIVVVEDVQELAIDHQHVVHLQARLANVEGRGEITLSTVLRQSLRMRPDRIVLGEARGAEVRELLTAMNTGHEGGCGTVHANTAADVIPRFEALGALAAMSPAAVHTQLASAVRVVLHLERVAGRRVLGEIALLRRRERRLEVVSAWTPKGRDAGWAELSRLLGLSGTSVNDMCMDHPAMNDAGPIPERGPRRSR